MADDAFTKPQNFTKPQDPIPPERCPIEEVALVVPETDDTTIPVMTFGPGFWVYSHARSSFF
ncbi:unnamed protein product [Rhodiola kirilowii]